MRAIPRCFIRSLVFAVWFCAAPLAAEEIAISYPGLSGDSASLWMAGEGSFRENGVDAKLVYMEGGRLSIQSLLSGHTQFMTGDAVSALSAVASGADIVLLGSAKNVLPYVFGVTKQVRRIQDLKGKVVGISQIGGRAGEIARMVIKNNGLDPDKDVVYLAVGGTMSRLAALATGKVQAAPISKGVVTAAQEKGLQIIEVEPIPLIIDALWTTRKYAEENPGMIYRVMRGYVAAIAAIIKDRPKTIAALRKYMRTADAKTPRWRLRELRRRSRSGADSQRAGDSEYPGNHLPHCAKACLAGNQEAALFRCGGTIAQRRLHRKTLQVKLKGD